MFSFLFGKGKEESAIVFDINSESVGAAVVMFGKQNKPRIVYTCREYFFEDKVKERGSRRLIEAMKNALSRVEIFLARNIFSHPVFKSSPLKKICYVFSDPWIESKPKNLTAEEFLYKLSADFGVPKEAFVVVEDKIALPKEIHDAVSSGDSSLREHIYISRAAVLAEFANTSFSEKDFIDSDVSSDPALFLLCAYFSRQTAARR